MKIRSLVHLTAATALAISSAAVSANEEFAALAAIDAAPMSAAELAKVEGKAHATFPLGALLLEKTNGRVAQTPAWEANHGLHPSRALSKAQVQYDTE